jgi:hydroxyacylglutathione hydrolase
MDTMEFQYGPMTVLQIPCLADNYAFLIRDASTGTVAAVDTPDAEVIDAELRARGWSLDLILNTHWHADHTGGNERLKALHGAEILGPAAEGDRIPGRDRALEDGDEIAVGTLAARVLSTPGHTRGHIVFHFADQSVAFVGDTLFALGCGRLFEGTPEQMWRSLQRLMALPDDTVVFCAHEYTQGHVRFAETIDPDHAPFRARAAEVARLRADDRPTVPTSIAVEKATNPFLRAGEPALAARLGQEGAAPVDVFAEIRRRKDTFRG